MSNLTRLTYLAIDHNRLHSLTKLGRCATLIELYAGNNLIKNIRDIFHLKVCRYFSHVVYYLSIFKYLGFGEFTYIRLMGQSNVSRS